MAAWCVILALAAAQSPPAQPASGPGGSDYAHAAVVRSQQRSGDRAYWLYEPAAPAPAAAPVVVFLHGYGASDPTPYDAMLRHLTRKGHSVIYPRYGSLWNPWAYERNAADAVADGLALLATPGHVAPLSGQIAFAGHSLGGILSLRLAQFSNAHGIPSPRALILHDAAGFDTPAYAYMRLDDLSAIPSDTVLVLNCAQTSLRDHNATEVWRLAWTGTAQIPRSLRNAIAIPTDRHGSPALISDHLGAQGGPVDAIDWYGYWKYTDASLDVVFRGTHREYVLDDGSELRNMGLWSDAVPVNTARTAADFGY